MRKRGRLSSFQARRDRTTLIKISTERIHMRMVKPPKVITHPTRLRMRSFACMVSVLALAAADPALAATEPAAPALAASAAVAPYTAAQFFETTSFSMANPDGLAFPKVAATS